MSRELRENAIRNSLNDRVHVMAHLKYHRGESFEKMDSLQYLPTENECGGHDSGLVSAEEDDCCPL